MKYIAISLLVAFLVVVGAYFVNEYAKSHYLSEEVLFTKHSATRCIIFEVGNLLNDYYHKNNKYPKKGELRNILVLNKELIRCGDFTAITLSGDVRDGFDEPINIKYIGNTILIYSKNLNFIDDDSSYLGVNLKSGALNVEKVRSKKGTER